MKIATARFCDQDPVTSTWREVPDGDGFWGSAAATQISPLQLLPLLYGLATEEQAAALRPHLAGYVAAPWTWWPSWSWHVGEAAFAQAGVTLLRYLVGFVEGDDMAVPACTLRPALPPALCMPGPRYTVLNLTVRDRAFDLIYLPLPDGTLRIGLRPHNGRPATVAGVAATHADGVTAWVGQWGTAYAVTLG